MDFFDVVHFSPPFWVRWWFVFLQEIYGIEDVDYYDDATSDKSSNYSTKLVSSITHSTDYYQVATTSSSTLSTYMSSVLIQNLTIPQHFKVTC